MANDLSFRSGDASTSSADAYVSITPADADLPGGTCRGLLVGTAGAANLMQQDGTVQTGVPLQQGYNPLVCRQVRAGTAASNIWALY